jgi:poly-gamma-glutamate synthase PgsB/CapB
VIDRIVELIAAHVLPLMRRTRRRTIRAMAERLAELDPAQPPTLLALGLHTMTVVRRYEEDLRRLDHRHAELALLLGRRASPDERRDLLADHLRETVSDPLRRRGDLAALDRWLDEEAFRERHVQARNRLLAAIEIGLVFLGRAGAAAIAEGDRQSVAHELFETARVDEFLRQRLEKGPRWQVRFFAADAFTRLLHAAGEDAPIARIEPGSVGPAVRHATDGTEHFLVQATCLELVLALSRATGDRILSARLTERPAEPSRHDFLLRRRVLDLLAARPSARFGPMLEKLVEVGDPSEHVRMGLTEAVAACPFPGRAAALRSLAGVGDVPEPSPRVRAAAVIAAARQTAPDAATAALLLDSVLESETHRLPLLVACEEAAPLVARAPEDSRTALAELLLGRVLELSSREDLSADAHEAAAAAAEAIDRTVDPLRADWTARLAAAAREVPAGGKAVVSLAGFPAAPEDPIWLGRILADLSRRDWGLGATQIGDELHLYRGDRFGRRFWRIVRELAHLDPGKRQAHLHTRGRKPRGLLRAPPGRLDEVVPTGVPGERVTVEGEAGWGRHVPSVDDILDLPLQSGREVRIFSSHGVTTLRPPATLSARLRTRLALSFRYSSLAAARLRSLTGQEAHERRLFVDAIRRLGVGVEFTRYPYATTPPAAPHVRELFGEEPPRAALAALGAAPFLHQIRDWMDVNAYYFLSPNENSQAALALAAAGFVAWFLGEAHLKRRRLASARARVPLSIGGWGTRGKSGTERLKAALLHGLGYEVLVKTTGCEAMVIHCLPDEPAHELFLFRSYDKASIWEVKDTLELAADLGVEVYLWECMALNPTYVELLERDWIRDDYVTLTNCFPDHEDVQGPAGIDIAECIAHFVPESGTCVTSEVSFLPVLEAAAEEQGTRLVSSPARDADMIPSDILALFPYQEHPRNIALVARLAEELEVPRDVAMAIMAENVVPDLGVLKTYPGARVRGRLLEFTNGMSANERTGFLSNWERTHLGAVDPEDPERVVMTVVNNRYDRVARSAVFARILVEDAVADAHVLIGTNLPGLETYLSEALEAHVRGFEILRPEELAARDPGPAMTRLGRLFARLRIPVPDAESLVRRIEVYAAGAGLELPGSLRPAAIAFAGALMVPRPDAPLELETIEAELAQSSGLTDILGGLIPSRDRGTEPPEVVETPGRSDLAPHIVHQLARLALHARLRARLVAVAGANQGPETARAFDDDVRRVYRALFRASLHVVADPAESGDRIIDRCARAVPPGTRAHVMGVQNIKGTGLDFVYRWLALDHVTAALRRLESPRVEERKAALAALEKHHDWGLVDAGLCAKLLGHPRFGAGELAPAVNRLLGRVLPIYEARRQGLAVGRDKRLVDRLIRSVEQILDPIDSVRRRRHARRVMKDLVARRISHARAAVELRRLYDREKGGWLKPTKGKG